MDFKEFIKLSKEALKKELTWWFGWGHLWDER